MTEKIKFLLNQLKNKKYRLLRKHTDAQFFMGDLTSAEFFEEFKTAINTDTPMIFEKDDFGFNRGCDMFINWGSGNLTPNYYRVISSGFDNVKKEIINSISSNSDKTKKNYGSLMLKYIDVCIHKAEKYKELAENQGNMRLYKALSKIPHSGAESFYEACVFLKMCIYFLRCSGIDHLGLGRFDQYMYPFYRYDKKQGITDAEILETIEGFFISINIDSDLYRGIQQGDNGQSIVLGGFDLKGNSVYNELSQLCMKASLELSLIDPKVNLRVGKNTPDEIYCLGTQLTKQGLGFPQYCNDDVVIPGLIKLGYAPEDAENYIVAACWEYIVPNCGGDYPNIQTMDFPLIVNRAITANLEKCECFDELINYVKEEIKAETDFIVKTNRTYGERPLLSVFTDGCIESLTDIWKGGTKYKNFGCHGAGIANATDSLAAIRKNIFEDKTISKSDLLNALSENFKNCENIRYLLKNSPKMGNNNEYADSIAYVLMKTFADNLNNKKNAWGGIWRAGTGSAMDYIYRAKNCPATADGRKSGEPYSSSFSPSLDVKTSGLLSVIQSFTKFDMTNIINGGPLSIEIHDSVLRNDEGINKTALLVKTFINLGGHQLQLNSINSDRLKDAQNHPENYPNLIVRVWGWSGYFNELDTEFQNHIIRRCEYLPE